MERKDHAEEGEEACANDADPIELKVLLNCVYVLVSEEKDLMSSGDAKFAPKGSFSACGNVGCRWGAGWMILNAEGDEVRGCD